MSTQPSLSQRAAGILLHVTSLPGQHGSGDLGPAARVFVDFLADAGQRWWQMLPVNPIGAGNSPYISCSAFAGDPLMISLERLVDDGLLERADVRPLRSFANNRVRYDHTIPYRYRRLRAAYAVFSRDASRRQRADFDRFRKRERAWLAEFALYRALKGANREQWWLHWMRAAAARTAAAVRDARKSLADEIEFAEFLQYLFDKQWTDLRAYARDRGVGLIGDLPIFVSHDSADVWANRNLFKLDARGRPIVVSGCPPDSFSKTGQLWGHPHYNWPKHKRTGFAWWIARFRRTFELFDAVRIDHFLGFHRAWTVPGRDKTAKNGVWTLSPGNELFTALRKKLGRLEIVAEDLGAVTPEALAMRDRFGFPGMRVLQQACWEGNGYDRPHTWPRGCVAYTGTHDTDTLGGWLKTISKSKRKGRDRLTDRERILRYINSNGRQVHWDMIRTLYASVADAAIVPMQDVLGLGGEARMNYPSTPTGNWEWRMPPTGMRPAVSKRLRELAETYERISMKSGKR